jgi:hypothetical protein
MTRQSPDDRGQITELNFTAEFGVVQAWMPCGTVAGRHRDKFRCKIQLGDLFDYRTLTRMRYQK